MNRSVRAQWAEWYRDQRIRDGRLGPRELEQRAKFRRFAEAGIEACRCAACSRWAVAA